MPTKTQARKDTIETQIFLPTEISGEDLDKIVRNIKKLMSLEVEKTIKLAKKSGSTFSYRQIQVYYIPSKQEYEYVFNDMDYVKGQRLNDKLYTQEELDNL
ncbi:MAG TPA: hypothetical protein VJB94_01325 [Candidatus Nanoarchaeia archaeon]|nr:hypothetical protein [Candidatus Nanoarchaeia archaeon]